MDVTPLLSHRQVTNSLLRGDAVKSLQNPHREPVLSNPLPLSSEKPGATVAVLARQKFRIKSLLSGNLNSTLPLPCLQGIPGCVAQELKPRSWGRGMTCQHLGYLWAGSKPFARRAHLRLRLP